MARAMINPNAQIVRRATPAPPAIQPPPLPAPTGSGANAQTVTSSGILTTLGTLVGTAVGGPGVGTAIGSGLGKLGDRAFGFDDPELPGDQLAPTGGPCPGFGSVRVNGVCVNLGDLGPGGGSCHHTCAEWRRRRRVHPDQGYVRGRVHPRGGNARRLEVPDRHGPGRRRDLLQGAPPQSADVGPRNETAHDGRRPRGNRSGEAGRESSGPRAEEDSYDGPRVGEGVVMESFDFGEWADVSLEDFIDLLEEHGYNALRAKVIGTLYMMQEREWGQTPETDEEDDGE